MVAFVLYMVFVGSREINCIKAEISEKCCIGGRVTKGVEHPAYARDNSKFFLHKLMTNVHIHNHVLIVGASLISSYPTSLRYLQLTIAYQFLYILLPPGRQPGVPHVEIFHLYICESKIFVHF